MRFLLGPAGSGKTFRCLAEIRAALAKSPDGPPLILIAPKQATFQLERQLLGDDTISGFTRLHVLSFDRLAEFAFENFHVARPKVLSAEGRVMVLRALLRRHEDELKLLGSSARRPGFAQEISGQLAELQQHHYGPARLRALAADGKLRRDLRDKLHDLAVLSEKYTDWLKGHDLQDTGFLLDQAVDQLRAERQRASTPFVVEHLWLDGFAEMTPQEHALLAAIIPFCQGATLAFCLETEPTPASSWLSIWSAIGKTFQFCRAQLAAVPGCTVETEILKRAPGKNRFAEGSELAVLEESWALPVAAADDAASLKPQVSVVGCPNPEAEAVYAAREIMKFVRQDKRNRFRDCAVLVRKLENYQPAFLRVFRRYEIPFFLDHRESVSHHPLAELTRGALRTVLGNWRQDDWFAALKAGFTPLTDDDLDRLENASLAGGWRGKKWQEPLPDENCEALRQIIFPPFDKFHRRLRRKKFAPTGEDLAEAINELWKDLKVPETLEKWSLAAGEQVNASQPASLHQTVYEQMRSWLENVARAFPHEPMPLDEWLPILEAGLAGLTVGAIPPALDEVLVGAIDRARNPDLKFALLLGMNESVFPAAPAIPVILTNSDRAELDGQNASLGLDQLNQISRERYLGYIACTRASEQLTLTFARQDADGRTLNPSPFIGHLQKSLRHLEISEFTGESDWHEAQHANELARPLVETRELSPGEAMPAAARAEMVSLLKLPAVKRVKDKLAQLHEPDKNERLSPKVAEWIYGPVLKSSVSRLEEFAQCPFRFFVHSGLRAEERKQFELDARERGSFQHEILKAFHDELTLEKKRWRDVTPAEARKRVERIAGVLAPDYREGLMLTDDQSRFTTRALTVALQDFVGTLVAWMRAQYDFDPAKAETGFGLEDPGMGAWQIELGDGHALALRGRVDRIDLFADKDHSLAVVMDYKSSARKLDKLLVEHGIQLQLLAYLAAVRRWPAEFFGAKKIVPAGVFYVNLRGQFEAGSSRTEVLADPEAQRLAYRHSGRFDAAFLARLDKSQARDQFNYQLNNDGSVRSNSVEAISCKDFTALLDQTEEQLRTLGQRIFAGEAAVDPYRKGTATACDYCEYRAICRIDGWTHEFRDLRPAGKPTDAGKAALAVSPPV